MPALPLTHSRTHAHAHAHAHANVAAWFHAAPHLFLPIQARNAPRGAWRASGRHGAGAIMPGRGMGTPMCARQRRASDVPRRMGTPSRAGSCRASEERKRADARKHAQAFSLPSVPALRGAQGVRAAVSGVSATACSAQVSTLCPSACATPCPALGTRSCPRACGAGAALTRLAMGAVGARSPPPRNAAGRCCR